MSLFIVNRFDENNAEDDNAEVREEKRLKKLQKLIEKRKSERSAPRENVTETVDVILEENILEPERCKVEPSPENNEESPPKKKIKPNIIKEEIPNDDIVEKEDKLVVQTPKTEFKVLGVQEFEKRKEVDVPLPHWLSDPKVISIDLKSSKTSIDNIPYLNDALKSKLKKDEIDHFFPVQAEVIPYILKQNQDTTLFWPKDVCVSAPTGSGKTLAYVLPIVQLLSSRLRCELQALVILPTKELAEQVGNVFKSYCEGTNLKVVTTSTIPLLQQKQQLMKYTTSKGWQSEVDILVSTPGRLVSFLQTDQPIEGFNLRHLQFLVIDEADRIMDHIQNDWLHHFKKHVGLGKATQTGQEPILNANSLFFCKRPPQKLFFSATFSHDPEKLKQWGMFQPKLFTASTTSHTLPLELIQNFVICDVKDKPIVLYHLIKEKNCKRVLCFTNSSQSTHLLTILLNNMGKEEGINASELSSASDVNNSRQRVLKDFQKGSLRVLVCTDALARGIDVPDCDLVVSYDPPKNTKTYIHRIGRTARAGKKGTAIVILSQNQQKAFKDILKTVGNSGIVKINVEQSDIEKLQEKYDQAQLTSKESLKNEKVAQIEKLKVKKRGTHKKRIVNGKDKKINVNKK